MKFADSTRLQAHGVHVGYGARAVLDGIDFAVPDRAVTAIIGPNGCGKSTLLRTLGHTLRPRAGHVSLDGASLHHVAPKQLARRVAMLPQAPTAPEGITVVDLVARGRQPYQSWLRQWSVEDEAAVRRALDLTGTTSLAFDTLDSLSGGQQQRVWIAFVVAQDSDILLLDEPTTFLDLAHAIEVLRLIETLHEDSGRTIVMVLHDLNLAVQYAQHLVVLQDGSIVTQGAPVDVLTADLLFDVFGLSAQVIQNPVGDGILVVPTKQPF
ncbi:ABC transporter ATP-binding protein [Dietzia sp. PP-33]|jgi:iron complex transport system ATP-binding protein|uniref:ABC transporter ATP-binding protein n=1 Tax=Dietzia sp. PP-33 TaxID=2957500 RepID=UPI0029BE5F2F|nr:ABC transporter ATP-binding protein [Dietzia sp. PP-33]MDX2358404.1 ABC transporter ATP-binding protein [Dietzia sp. PP-33]